MLTEEEREEFLRTMPFGHLVAVLNSIDLEVQEDAGRIVVVPHIGGRVYPTNWNAKTFGALAAEAGALRRTEVVQEVD